MNVQKEITAFNEEVNKTPRGENASAARILGFALIRSAGLIANAITGLEFEEITVRTHPEDQVKILVDFDDTLHIKREDVEQ